MAMVAAQAAWNWDTDMIEVEDDLVQESWLSLLELDFNQDGTGASSDISAGTFTKGVYAGEVIRVSFQA